MLVAMVFLEVGLVIAGMVYLYGRFSDIIEANLYRIHHQADALFSLLLTEMEQMMVMLIGINLLAILIADHIWTRYVKRVLNTFRLLVNKVADLDFREDGKQPTEHKVLSRTLIWRKKERDRALAIRAMLQSLKAETDFSDPKVVDALHHRLTEVRRRLPPYSRRYVGRL